MSAETVRTDIRHHSKRLKPERSDTLSEIFLKNVESEAKDLFDSAPVWFSDHAFIALIGRIQGELCLALWAFEPSCNCEVQVQQVIGSTHATPAIVHGRLDVTNHFASMPLPAGWNGKECLDLSVSVRAI